MLSDCLPERDSLDVGDRANDLEVHCPKLAYRHHGRLPRTLHPLPATAFSCYADRSYPISATWGVSLELRELASGLTTVSANNTGRGRIRFSRVPRARCRPSPGTGRGPPGRPC